MEHYCYFTFSNTYQAIKAEKLLTGEKWRYKMVPVPRRISSSCGTALRCALPDGEEIKVFLQAGGVLVEGSYKDKE
ncbi:MAG TPA: hypothetical protein DCQ14_05850 [Firmicutes bacterium]|nr:hypothetical protein [Bacillota bacterium]